MPNVDQLRNQVAELVQRLSLLQRVIAGAVLLAALGLIAYLAAAPATPTYRTVFANLEPADASAAVQRLQAGQVPYRLAGDGNTIQVPEDKVADTRLMLAAEGLPQGGVVGFELFDKTNFGLTDFAQRVNYQRALEGELGRTISRLESVEAARVHIVIPEPSLYTQEKKAPTASVVLKLRPGRKPTSGQVKGVAHLVSSSVEGLTPANLTIVDANGTMLNEQTGTGSDGLQASASYLELQRTVEKNLERSIMTMLDKVLGPNKAAVTVTANLDFDRVEENAETFTPAGTTPQIRSERKVADNQTSQATTPGGVPGTDSNIPTYQSTQANNQSTRQLTDTTINYELSKTVAKTVKAPGSVKRLAVAVVLDQQAPVAAGQAETIQQLVATAAAVDTKRGDLVTVSALPFDRTSIEAEQAALVEAGQRDQLMEYLRLGALVLVPLLVIVGLLVAVRMARRPAVTALQSFYAGAKAGETVVTDLLMDAEKLLKQAQVASPNMEQVTFLARKDPAMIAQLMRTWLQDDGSRK